METNGHMCHTDVPVPNYSSLSAAVVSSLLDGNRTKLKEKGLGLGNMSSFFCKCEQMSTRTPHSDDLRHVNPGQWKRRVSLSPNCRPSGPSVTNQQHSYMLFRFLCKTPLYVDGIDQWRGIQSFFLLALSGSKVRLMWRIVATRKMAVKLLACGTLSDREPLHYSRR